MPEKMAKVASPLSEQFPNVTVPASPSILDNVITKERIFKAGAELVLKAENIEDAYRSLNYSAFIMNAHVKSGDPLCYTARAVLELRLVPKSKTCDWC
jgi:hypothetical protein